MLKNRLTLPLNLDTYTLIYSKTIKKDHTQAYLLTLTTPSFSCIEPVLGLTFGRQEHVTMINGWSGALRVNTVAQIWQSYILLWP